MCQLVFGAGLAETIFSIPLLPPATTPGGDDAWETAVRMSREADAATTAARGPVWGAAREGYSRKAS